MIKEINFLPFPGLITKRLILRQLNESDSYSIFSIRSDNTINKYLDRPKMTNIDEAEEFIKKIIDGIKLNKWIYWGICFKGNPELIGTICLWNFSDDKTIAEIGYELLAPFQGKGLMNEALKCIIHYGFQTIGLEKIEAYTHRENSSSTRLLVKNDFQFIPDRHDENNSNNIIYTLTRRI